MRVMCMQGNTMLFADFAAAQLQELITHSTTNDEKVKYSHCLKGEPFLCAKRSKNHRLTFLRANFISWVLNSCFAASMLEIASTLFRNDFFLCTLLEQDFKSMRPSDWNKGGSKSAEQIGW